MKTMKDYEDGFEQNPSGTITKIITKIFFWIVGLSLASGAIFWTIDLITTPAQTASGVIKKTLNADNVIQNYEWFKQQYNDYKAINVKISDADSSVAKFKREAGPRDKWTFEDKNEYARLTTIYDGLKYQRADIAGKYNARSKMMNRELFKGDELPLELSQ